MMKPFILVVFLVVMSNSLYAYTYHISFPDTVPTSKSNDQELKQLQAEYSKHYKAQKRDSSFDDDYLWTGKPINHEDLGLSILPTDTISLKQYQVNLWIEQGLDEDEINTRLATKSIRENDLKLSIEESLHFPNTWASSPRDQHNWEKSLVIQQELPNPATQVAHPIDLSSINLYSFQPTEEKDGINQIIEIWPGTITQIEGLFWLSKVSFNPNSVEINIIAAEELNQLTTVLEEEDMYSVEIIIHCPEGSKIDNLKKANSIKQYLMYKGIREERIVTGGNKLSLEGISVPNQTMSLIRFLAP